MEVLEIEDYNKNICCNSVYNDCRIPFIDANETSYKEFFENFLLQNKACLIKNIGQTWEAYKYWVKNDNPNFYYLHTKYGNAKVNVQNCNQKYYNSQEVSEWVFKDYLNYWEDHIKQNYTHKMPLYYLKDWHLKNTSLEDNFYQVPVYFAADWLNEYLVENCLDDYRFVYMGPQNSWTPLHSDVMTSYSWSTNICGLKRWVLFPPGEENHLRDNLNNLPYDLSNMQLNCNSCEIIQHPGETIFVPSNWYHQVWNLKDTISINHNWINACNIYSIWTAMVKELQDVKKEIDDCKEMDDFVNTCQIMLQASFGMNFEEFYRFIEYIANKRINFLTNNKMIILNDGRILGKNYAIFDLKILKNLFESCLLNVDIQQLNIDVKIESVLINMKSIIQI